MPKRESRPPPVGYKEVDKDGNVLEGFQNPECVPAEARQRQGDLPVDGQRADHQQGLPAAQGPAANVHAQQEGRVDGEGEAQDDLLARVDF